MDIDLSGQPEIVQVAYGYAVQAWELALTWLLSPAAWSQFGLLLLAWFLSGLITRRIRPPMARIIDPGR
jgi:potassium efflux system protein